MFYSLLQSVLGDGHCVVKVHRAWRFHAILLIQNISEATPRIVHVMGATVIAEFVVGHCSEPRLAVNEAVGTRYRVC